MPLTNEANICRCCGEVDIMMLDKTAYTQGICTDCLVKQFRILQKLVKAYCRQVDLLMGSLNEKKAKHRKK